MVAMCLVYMLRSMFISLFICFDILYHSHVCRHKYIDVFLSRYSVSQYLKIPQKYSYF